MTTTASMQPSQPFGPAFGLGAAAEDADLSEELCRVQAHILGMGDDNYQRLRRVCPDTDRRYFVLQLRVNRQVQLALAAQVPRWRVSRRPNCDPAATSTAARDVWLELEFQRRTSVPNASRGGGDWFAPGPPHDAEVCWRCDARDADSDIGLCGRCHASLVSRSA